MNGDHYGPIAEFPNVLQLVGDEHDSHATAPEFAAFLDAARLECRDADGQHFIDQENFRTQPSAKNRTTPRDCPRA